MANSKLLGTYADASNNDVVSTVGDQTILGKKTFDGGVLIKGDISGSDILAGYVGEIKVGAEDAGFTGYAAAGQTQVVLSSLNKGIYLVIASATSGLGSGLVYPQVSLLLNGTVIATNRNKANGAFNSDVGNSIWSFPLLTIVKITSDNSTLTTRGDTAGGYPGYNNFIRAIRIA